MRRLIYQLCQAIEWCHQHDVVHRDIKVSRNLTILPAIIPSSHPFFSPRTSSSTRKITRSRCRYRLHELRFSAVTQHRALQLCDFGFARTVNTKGKGDLTDYVATRW